MGPAGQRLTAVSAGRSRWLRWLGVVLVTAVVLAQVWPWLRAPLLPFEDGALLFAGHYARFDASVCVQSYAGYVSFGSNLLAALCCRLPVEWVPSAFVAAAALTTVAAASAMLHPAWRRLLPPAAQLAGALLVVVPIGNHLLLGSLAYAQWAMLWWLAIVMLHPERRHGVAGLGEALLVVALAWSHPLAGLLLPLAVARPLRRVAPRRWSVLAVAVAAYWALVLSRDGLDAQVAAGGPVAVVLELLLVRGALEALLGEVGRSWLVAQAGAWAPWAVGALILVAAGWAAWRGLRGADEGLRVRAAALAGFAVLVVTASACSRPAAGGGMGWVVRYVWVSRVALLLLLVWAAGVRCRAPWQGMALCFTVLLFGAWAWRSNRSYYGHAAGAEFVQMLIAELAAQEQRLGGRAAVTATLPRVQASIVVRPR